MKTFQETLKHNDDMIEYHAERWEIARRKRDFFLDLDSMANRGGYWDERLDGFIDVDVDDLKASASDFLKAEKQGLKAVKAFVNGRS
jgi:hypothetical protein|tara:strand:+ start:476 stop:736 length:261 start_codon:yes stop_codon:yes gene_type:complete